jgi:Uma2 family endonuclease
MYLLENALRGLAPANLRVRREMTIVLNRTNRPEPDLCVVRAEAASKSADETAYQAQDVLLAVEVMSPESRDRDLKRKPQLYAQAGIPHFWRVQQGEGRRPIVFVYELDEVTESYLAVGVFHDHLKLSEPFEIDVDLTEIDRL